MYYEKYIKYKTKYFNLVETYNKKILKQNGGTKTLESILLKYINKRKSTDGNVLIRQNIDIQNLENIRDSIITKCDQLTKEIDQINNDIKNPKMDEAKNNKFITDRYSKQSELYDLNEDIQFIDSILPSLITSHDALKSEIDAKLALKNP